MSNTLRCATLPAIVLALVVCVSGCAHQRAATPGPYWVSGKLCGEDDCDNIPGRWRALADVALYAEPDSAAPVIGRIASGEWVNAVDKKTRYVPQRGIVRVAGEGLSIGDVVYGPLPGEDDAHTQIWRDGQRITIEKDAETPQIEWDAPSDAAPMRTMWVRVERAAISGGWLRDPSDFACMGENPGSDENC